MEDLGFEEAKAPRKNNRIVKELVLIVTIIFVIMVFRSSLFEPYRIPTGSMIPTLKIGDYIIVNKFAYGAKLPFSDFTLGDINLNPKYLTKQELPKRGDIIVFKFPKDPSINYIKRVVGLPGDTIEIKDKVLYLNDVQIKTLPIKGDKYLVDMNKKYKKYKLNFFEEYFGEIPHIIQQDSDNYYSKDKDKITVKPGHVYVMGDNRDFSFDSRFWSTVPVEYIKGRAEFVWMSVVFPTDGGSFIFRSARIGEKIR
ncbi:signal peptidase I [Halobacteriovorax sp. HLS]|uniref:signal peptidase I n=1 Tax=Halobacteriovorax sp. HLS TaxID=2234000 RepID=UPI000FD70EE8|nr:signal peptidase I [Halobacteriovorax sp. HLS]